jgi:flagellar biosynthetic protein FliQ
MSPEYIVKLGQDTMLLVLHVAGPTLVVALVVGLAVSIFQAVTQIHEMTLTFIPKMLAVAAVLTVLLPWTIRCTAAYLRSSAKGRCHIGSTNFTYFC